MVEWNIELEAQLNIKLSEEEEKLIFQFILTFLEPLNYMNICVHGDAYACVFVWGCNLWYMQVLWLLVR